jgi:hypothetical protein
MFTKIRRKTMNKVVLVCGLAGVMLASYSSCDKAKEMLDKAKKSVKVDCDKLCERAFRECLVEYLVHQRESKQLARAGRTIKAGGPKAVERVRKSKQIGKLRDKCIRHCGGKLGVSGNARKINPCLEKKDCKEFAKCLVETGVFKPEEWLGKPKKRK